MTATRSTDTKEYIKLREAAALISVSIRTVYKLIEEKKLPTFKPTDSITRVKRADVLAYIESTRQ